MTSAVDKAKLQQARDNELAMKKMEYQYILQVKKIEGKVALVLSGGSSSSSSPIVASAAKDEWDDFDNL